MSKSIKGTQTEKNLLTSFAGESQARMRYTYFASVAKKEGYEQISAIFTETADQEKEHAKRMFKFLEGVPAFLGYFFPVLFVLLTTTKVLSISEQGKCTVFSSTTTPPSIFIALLAFCISSELIEDL